MQYQDMSDPDSLPPFPILMDEPAERWQWPAPPLSWRHLPAPGIDIAQPCRIEPPSGASVEGFIVGMDMAACTLAFRTRADGSALMLPFSRLRRLTLTMPLRPAEGRDAERVPVAAHQREFRLLSIDSAEPLTGRSVGHVETSDGLFLFPAIGDERQLLRVFVPRCAYSRCEFGPSAQDLAAQQWIATPRELLEAIERQRRMPVLPIGQALLNLGMVTADQLQRALAEPQGGAPLGERLVASGIISSADLHTAIAHKMGYPLVDLTRFPTDPAACAKLALRSCVKHRALPLMIDQKRLIVAVDRPSRAIDLQTLFAMGHFTVVPVLASKEQILLALSALSQHDTWAANVSIRAEFFSTIS